MLSTSILKISSAVINKVLRHRPINFWNYPRIKISCPDHFNPTTQTAQWLAKQIQRVALLNQFSKSASCKYDNTKIADYPRK